MLYAVPVEATIANGRVIKLDTAAAEKMPGVRAIFHRGNIGKIFRSVLGPGFEGIVDERRPPFEDDVVRYYGQYIALAVGRHVRDRQGRRRRGSRHLREGASPNVDTDLEADDEPDVVPTTFGPAKRLQSERGDAEKRLRRPRRSSSTRPTSRRPRRTTRSSCRRRPRSGTAEC